MTPSDEKPGITVMSTMKLPSPRERMAGCVWLPRLLAKARHLQRGELPPDYAARFCHSTGVDGHFMAHFDLSRDELLDIAERSDDAVALWFRSRPAGGADCIEAWNEIALNLGRPGYPMAERLPLAKTTTYRHLDTEGMTTVFEILEADERGA